MMRAFFIPVALLFPALSAGEDLPLPASDNQDLEPVPMIVGVGVSSVVPFDDHGAVTSVDASISAEMSAWTSLGLRVSVAMSPIQAPSGPDAEHAWAAIVEVRNRLGIGGRVDPVVVVAGGFVVGDRDGESISNLVLPYGQLGLGLHLLLPTGSDGTAFYIDPELGIVPGVLYDRGPLSVVAPYSAIRFGVRLP
jgi:hypothetical protein